MSDYTPLPKLTEHKPRRLGKDPNAPSLTRDYAPEALDVTPKQTRAEAYQRIEDQLIAELGDEAFRSDPSGAEAMSASEPLRDSVVPMLMYFETLEGQEMLGGTAIKVGEEAYLTAGHNFLTHEINGALLNAPLLFSQAYVFVDSDWRRIDVYRYPEAFDADDYNPYFDIGVGLTTYRSSAYFIADINMGIPRRSDVALAGFDCEPSLRESFGHRVRSINPNRGLYATTTQGVDCMSGSALSHGRRLIGVHIGMSNRFALATRTDANILSELGFGVSAAA